MPIPATSEFPIPKSWDEFEDIVWEIFRRLWLDPEARRYGSSGQAQQGVDSYGVDRARDKALVGVQCKRYAIGKFTRQVLVGEIAKAEAFKPPLARYIIATTDKRDARLQEAVRLINQQREAAGKFTIDIWFWEDICSALADPANEDLLNKYYPMLFGRMRSIPTPKNLWTVPYRGLGEDLVGRQEDLVTLHELLKDHGKVGITGMSGVGKTQLAVEYAYLHHGDYPHGVFWLNAANPFLAELSDLAETLGLAEVSTPRDQAAFKLRDYLAHNSQALLVFDNLNKPQDLNQEVASGVIPVTIP